MSQGQNLSLTLDGGVDVLVANKLLLLLLILHYTLDFIYEHGIYKVKCNEYSQNYV
jgi:hypothetical protein